LAAPNLSKILKKTWWAAGPRRDREICVDSTVKRDEKQRTENTKQNAKNPGNSE
jgi:hypothetical protein